jgi:hypothetical protein
MARERADQQRFQANTLSIDQISNNLRVLATFRTKEPGSSYLTIRRGIFYKTTGKLNFLAPQRNSWVKKGLESGPATCVKRAPLG